VSDFTSRWALIGVKDISFLISSISVFFSTL
jgi:hypothetical protein